MLETLLLIVLLTAPFAGMGALIAFLIVVIGNRSAARK
jgi:hypothetical protein